MIPTRAYRQQAAGQTRIDLVLALFDGAIDRMDKAITFLRQKDVNSARTHQIRAQMLIMQLAAGIDLSVECAGSVELLRLYEFCVNALAHGGLKEIESARNCLDTVRSGFRAIREEAAQLERRGALPSADSRLVEAVG